VNVNQLKGKTIAFAASGGLDSCTIVRWLSNHGVNVVSITADLGQPDERNLDDVAARMIKAGAAKALVVDAKAELAEAAVKVLQSQACYEGRYWNTTGIARYVTVSALVKTMKSLGLSILAHGATGRGNDQVRFQLATNMLAPEFEVYAPWRDEIFLQEFRGRSEMISFCNSNGIPITATKEAPYSTDANMLGLTHEAGKLESLSIAADFITPGMGKHSIDAPDHSQEVSIQFQAGRPIAINGQTLSPTQCILMANKIAGNHGVGIGLHLVENRFVGIKSRGVYESPGMELLGTVYALLLQLVLDRRAFEYFEMVSRVIAKQIYQGYWFDLGSQMALASVAESAKYVTGTITVSLYKGKISFVSAENVPHSLYSEADASMEDIGSYDHQDSEGFLRVLGVSARILARKGVVKQVRANTPPLQSQVHEDGSYPAMPHKLSPAMTENLSDLI